MIKLSILVPSVNTRRNNFLPNSLDMLYGQLELLPESTQSEVEILYLIDNKTIMLGEKRNTLIDIAQGKYIVFVDDDDRIEPDYISSILEATDKDCDAICFQASVSLNGEEPKICYYSIHNKRDYNKDDAYYRIPNHIACVKKEVSNKVSFPNILYGEDSLYAKLLLPYIKTEHVINKVLYHYDYNEATTEAQIHIRENKLRLKTTKAEPIIDVVFISDAKNAYFRSLTENAIRTCLLGSNSMPVNIIVVERQPNIKYNHATTIPHSGAFNYNACANLGARSGSAKWIMIANNDLQFSSAWLHHLITANHPFVSPKCPDDKRQTDILENTVGTECGRNMSGWCFAVTRSLFEQIGGFDEDFDFWFADNATIEQCLKIGVEPMLVPNSVVKHLGSQTFKTIPRDKYDDMTWRLCKKFNDKYGRNLFNDNKNYKLWLEKNP